MQYTCSIILPLITLVAFKPLNLLEEPVPPQNVIVTLESLTTVDASRLTNIFISSRCSYNYLLCETGFIFLLLIIAVSGCFYPSVVSKFAPILPVSRVIISAVGQKKKMLNCQCPSEGSLLPSELIAIFFHSVESVAKYCSQTGNMRHHRITHSVKQLSKL